MIQPEELRIGNIIMGCEEFIVSSIQDYGVGCEGLYRPANNGCYDFDGLYGITVTEEWLVNLGCEKEDEQREDFPVSYFGPGRKFRITKNDGGHWTYWPEELWGMCIDLGKKPNIHTLQNIFYALNGQELKYIE